MFLSAENDLTSIGYEVLPFSGVKDAPLKLSVNSATFATGVFSTRFECIFQSFSLVSSVVFRSGDNIQGYF